MGPHLVGRRHEFGELARLVAGAATGEGALVVLSGEAGIGKTTTLSWLAGTAASAGMPVLAGRAVADEGAPAFWPWLRAFAAGRGLGLSPDVLEIGSGPPAQARFVAIERAANALLAAVPATGLLVTLDDLQWADDATVQLPGTSEPTFPARGWSSRRRRGTRLAWAPSPGCQRRARCGCRR